LIGLYKDATIYLERKYQRYVALCQKCVEVDTNESFLMMKIFNLVLILMNYII